MAKNKEFNCEDLVIKSGLVIGKNCFNGNQALEVLLNEPIKKDFEQLKEEKLEDLREKDKIRTKNKAIKTKDKQILTQIKTDLTDNNCGLITKRGSPGAICSKTLNQYTYHYSQDCRRIFKNNTSDPLESAKNFNFSFCSDKKGLENAKKVKGKLQKIP